MSSKLLGQRKKFNLAVASSDSSDFEDLRKAKSPEPIFNQFNISLSIADDGSLRICTTTDGLDDDDESDRITILPSSKNKKTQRSHSQRSNKSNRTPLIRNNNLNVSTSSDDEAFMNNDDNFQKSPRPLRRSLRKRKTSSLKRRKPVVQTVPEMQLIMRMDSPPPLPDTPPPFEDPVTTTVTALDDTLDLETMGDLWVDNDIPASGSSTSETGGSGFHVLSERSFLIATAETEDALSEFSDYNAAGDVFKMPYPVSYRPNLTKRKLVIESDEEFITQTYRAPVKRNCIRYYL